MKRVIQAILTFTFILAFVVFIFFFARMRQENLDATLPVAGRVIDFGTIPGKASGSGSEPAPVQRSKILPEWGEIFLNAIDMNLDEDEDLEQVVTVKPASTENGRISLVIADFQPSTGSYFRLWKGDTLATKPNAFIVQPRDLLGDGSVDLLCFGIDDTTLQTLDVFRRGSSGPVSYFKAFSGSGVSIVVEDLPDIPIGGSGSSSVNTATISVYESESSGISPLDQKKISYSWISSEDRFVKGAESLVPGANIERIFIQSVLTGRAEDFESYLHGLWVKESTADRKPTLLYFDPQGRTISIHSGQEQQQWDWGGSNPAYVGIYTSISNSAVPEMLRVLGIDLVGKDRVRVRATSQQIVKFAMQEDWNGVYDRSSGETASAMHSELNTIPADASFMVGIDGSSGKLSVMLRDFNGFYVTESGLSLELQDGKFRFNEGDSSSKGFFSLLRMENAIILDLGLIDDKSIPSGRQSYIATIRSGKNSGIGALILQPARILSDRIERLYKPDLVFSKFENQGRR